MADERPAPTTPPPTDASGSSTIPYVQLTQARVPLEEAGAAFTVPDASGRLPIVVLPEQPSRIRNEFVMIGIVAIVCGVLFDIEIAIRGGLVGLGLVAIFLGVFRSFMVPVPEGARALLLKAGRFSRSVGPGRHIVAPWIIVSHVVTLREIPFSASAVAVPTRDDVRVDLDLLLTFTIAQPEKFVFEIAAPDFDQVCQAAAFEAIREMVRTKAADEMLDLGGEDYARLRSVIGEALAPYGIEVRRVVVTHVEPPAEFMDSRESRRLAAVRRDEQTEQLALEERLQADRDALERQRIAARREQIDLEAANEALRLERLEERLTAYPAASRQDVLDRRIAVASQLAGNTRAMVQVGPGGDVADALILDSLADEAPPSSTPRSGRARRTTEASGDGPRA
jgi:regulator of protease activity HflC (stomatin/prohibitin superfamily)